MRIIDMNFMGGKSQIKILAFRKKPIEIIASINGGIMNNPTIGMIQTSVPDQRS